MQVELSFMIKKMLSVVLMPLSIGIILAIIGLLFLYFNKTIKAKKYLSLSVFWIILISWAPFSNLMLQPLEDAYPKLKVIPKNIQYILLLGGDRDKRTWEALRLYHKIPNVKIITSGYSLNDDISEAKKTAIKLIESGIPEKSILMQELAKTTFEEAIYMKKRVKNEPFILITSAYHMPRSMAIFKKAGLNVTAAPADFNNPKESTIFTMLQGKELQKTERAWHEYFGLLLYKIQGKI